MRFVLLTALRETRSAWKRLVFFFFCIAVGVGAIVDDGHQLVERHQAPSVMKNG